MRQLAKWAGVSPATVSLALRGDRSIPAKTQQRIERLAAAKGYRSDPVVANLMARLRKTRSVRGCEKIAFLTSWPNPDTKREAIVKDPNYMSWRSGICDRANALGYEIDEFWTKEPGLTAARLTKILYSRGIRGLILAPLHRPIGHLSLDWQYFAVATVTYTVTKPEVHRVTHCHYSGMQLALRQLKRRGYKRPGFATMLDQNERVRHSWEAGYLVHNQALRPKDRIPPLLTPRLTIKEFKAWFEKYKPDVVVSNIVLPLKMLLELGYDIPKEVSFASLDRTANDPEEAKFNSVAGINQLPFHQGAAVADLVIKLVQNNEFGLPRHPVTLHMDGVWEDGPTARSLVG